MSPKGTPGCGRRSFGGVGSFGPLHSGGGAQASHRGSPGVRGPSPSAGVLCELRRPAKVRARWRGEVGINAQF